MRKLKSQRLRKNGKLSDKIKWGLIRISPLIALIWFIWAQNNLLLTREMVYTTTELPKSFVGYKLMHISDINNSSLNIVKHAKKAEPDIILLTGGYSSKSGNFKRTESIVNKLTNIAPVYYIYNGKDAGNELANTSAINLAGSSVEIDPKLKDLNTFITDNYGPDLLKDKSEDAKIYLEYVQNALNETANDTIRIAGISKADTDLESYLVKSKTLELIGDEPSKTTMMLTGGIANLNVMADTHLDISLFGGTYGTNKISDTYKKGIYALKNTQLFVSGGVGKGDGVLRILNFPEVQLIVLSDGTIENDTPLEKFIGKFFKDPGHIFENDAGLQEYKHTYIGNSY